MPIDQDLKDSRILYAKLGINKKWSGERSIFDNCDFRQISKNQTVQPIASIEVKMLNRESGKINLIYLSKYENVTITQELLTAAAAAVNPKFFFISSHLADVKLQDICKGIGFEMIVDRGVLVRNRLPVDGIHLSYVRRFK